MENAIRHAKSNSAEQQINIAADLLHKNALVAADNPNAWFQDAPTSEEISSVTPDNRMISYPYTKRMNAIMDVDQSAAIVVVSDRFIETHGGRERAVAVLSGAGAEEVWNPIQRKSLSTCIAMQTALASTLSNGDVAADDISAFDLYSCFPAPVELALDQLNVELDDPRPFSVTGGLAYAGGPGNNYVMHSLATAVARLRNNQQEKILITGVGMANTKHSATLLAHAEHIPAGATGETLYRIETGDEPLEIAKKVSGIRSIVSYTIEYDRDATPINVIYILDTEDGRRAIANAVDAATAAENLLGEEPIGRSGDLIWDESQERQYFTLH